MKLALMESVIAYELKFDRFIELSKNQKVENCFCDEQFIDCKCV